MSSTARYCLFETPLGTCAVAWTDAGICGASLPERAARQTRTRILRRHATAIESAPTATINDAIDDIVRLLSGEPLDLSHISLDESGLPELNRRVYAITRAIPPGRTRTYGDIANELGDPMLAQRVGQALGHNPIPIITPCHRVLAASGKMGGFSAPGGTDTKRRMLLIEHALPHEPLDLFEAMG